MISGLLKTLVGSFSLLIFLVWADWAFASTLYLSPAGGNIGQGTTLAVQVGLNTQGEAVNAVSAYLSYPADIVDVSYVTPSSTFAIEAEKSFGGGVIKISRGNINPVSGTVTVATIGLRAKTTGSAKVSFIGGSAVPRASDSSDSLTGSSGGVYNVGVSGPAPTPTKATAGPTQPGRSTQDTFAPKITDLKLTSVSTSSATISWKTDEKADSYLEYGLEKGRYFLSAGNGNLVTDHSLTLESPLLVPGAKFNFRVKSKDVSGNEGTSADMQFQLLGYRVKIRLSDAAGRPLVNAQVALYSDPIKAMTDSRGEVVFDNITPGKHLVMVKSANFEKTSEINVINSVNVQSFDLKVDAAAFGKTSPFGSKLFQFIAIVSVAGLGLVSLLLVWKKRRTIPQP